MTDAYDVTLDRAPRRVVVKLYRDGDGTAPLEWSRLGFAQRVALPVPEPIVADLESVWFGRPTVVRRWRSCTKRLWTGLRARSRDLHVSRRGAHQRANTIR